MAQIDLVAITFLRFITADEAFLLLSRYIGDEPLAGLEVIVHLLGHILVIALLENRLSFHGRLLAL